MDWPLAVAIYFICWWLTLFTILPIGVRTQQEEGHVIPGTVESAPEKPHILKKLAATTLISSVVFLIVYLLLTTDVLRYEDIPFLPKLAA